MRALVYEAPRRLNVEDYPRPLPPVSWRSLWTLLEFAARMSRGSWAAAAIALRR